MKDPIERQAAIDALADYIHNVDKVIGTGKLSTADCRDAAESVLEDLPSAQPEQQKAIWALHTYMPHHYYCTHCKKDSPYNKTWSCCPNCGYEMEDYV